MSNEIGLVGAVPTVDYFFFTFLHFFNGSITEAMELSKLLGRVFENLHGLRRIDYSKTTNICAEIVNDFRYPNRE
jgi:hypothetical protein